jgi:hypothetical protein
MNPYIEAELELISGYTETIEFAGDSIYLEMQQELWEELNKPKSITVMVQPS